MKQKIGFIGLGSLGTPIALNLLESRYPLSVYNRTLSKTTPLQEKGAEVCETVAALAKQCEVVFSIVSDDKALHQICEGEGGLLSNLPKGSLHISLSTILPKTAAKLQESHSQRQLQYLASPVFGRPEAAVARKLNYVISGAADSRVQAGPFLKDSGGMNIFDFGDQITAANTVKLCGNFLIASALEAIGESIQMASKSGIDPTQMWSMFTQTLFNSPLYANYSNIILKRQFEPAAFSMKLGLKDMNLVLEQAASAGQKMPLASLIQEKMALLVQGGKEDLDWSAFSLTGS
jgi:3-hydroxyisobutyrate dehydrogenase-like beta-hydroxyacid dehydrogenase